MACIIHRITLVIWLALCKSDLVLAPFPFSLIIVRYTFVSRSWLEVPPLFSHPWQYIPDPNNSIFPPVIFFGFFYQSPSFYDLWVLILLPGNNVSLIFLFWHLILRNYYIRTAFTPGSLFPIWGYWWNFFFSFWHGFTAGWSIWCGPTWHTVQ